MITVHIKLYGTLPQYVAGYDPALGLTCHLKKEACVQDLLRDLGLHNQPTGMVVMDGRVVPATAQLQDGARIRIFQVAHGG